MRGFSTHEDKVDDRKVFSCQACMTGSFRCRGAFALAFCCKGYGRSGYFGWVGRWVEHWPGRAGLCALFDISLG